MYRNGDTSHRRRHRAGAEKNSAPALCSLCLCGDLLSFPYTHIKFAPGFQFLAAEAAALLDCICAAVRSTAAITRKKFSPRIFLMSASEYPRFISS